MKGDKRPGRPREDVEEKSRALARSLSLPDKLWRILEEVCRDRMDNSLSQTVKSMLLIRLAQMHYLSEEQKKALG